MMMKDMLMDLGTRAKPLRVLTSLPLGLAPGRSLSPICPSGME